MKAQITIKQLNPDYDSEYAKIYNFGRESADNNKANWSVTMGIEGEVVSFEKKENAIFKLKDSEIKNVWIFDYKNAEGISTQIIISNSLVDRLHEAARQKYHTSHLYIYVKNTDNYYTMSEPNRIAYIACEDFPKELEQYLVKS